MKQASEILSKRVLTMVLSQYFFHATNPLKTKAFNHCPYLTTPPHPLVRGGGQVWLWCVVVVGWWCVWRGLGLDWKEYDFVWAVKFLGKYPKISRLEKSDR